jgi:hypothetical protein
MKVTSISDWMKQKMDRTQGWIKLNVAVDVETRRHMTLEIK